jgi:hypothetical protein
LTQTSLFYSITSQPHHPVHAHFYITLSPEASINGSVITARNI